MFDTINGIPLHPLVVHAVVVLVPLAIVGTIAIAVKPAWRRPYGPLVVGAALVATVLCPVATSSGEELEQRVGRPEEHAELGDQLVWFVLALLIASALLVWLDRRPADKRPAPRTLMIVAVVAVIAGLAAGVQTYRVGDSGARAAWGNVGASSGN